MCTTMANFIFKYIIYILNAKSEVIQSFINIDIIKNFSFAPLTIFTTQLFSSVAHFV